MLRNVSVQVSRNFKNISRLCEVAGAGMPRGLLVGAHAKVVRNFNVSLMRADRDPCNPNAGQEEEEECTVTPCCRPFRLQKEHPMKNINKEKEKAAASKDEACKKDDKKKEVKKDTKKAPAPA